VRLHGCHNRPPLQDAIQVQDGWTDDGRRIIKQMPFVMSRDCRHDLKLTDPGCAGCWWRDAVAG
jgi:hypothetical protein